MKSSTARHSAARADARMDLRADREAESGVDSIYRVPTAHRRTVSVLARHLGIGHCLSKMRAWDSMAARPAHNSSWVWQTGRLRHRLAVRIAPRQHVRRGM